MDPCYGNFTITNQTDIDDGPLRMCHHESAQIYIRNAIGTLTFSNLTQFPNLLVTGYLEISQATSLTVVSLPLLGSSKNCSDSSYGPFVHLNIAGVPSITSFTFYDSTCISDLVLSDIGDDPFELAINYNEIQLGRVGTVGGDLNIISNGNVHIAYDGLTEVGRSLSIRNNTNCTFNFDKVSNISSLLFTDNVDTKLPLFTALERAQNIHIHGRIDTSIGPNIFPALKYVPGNVTVEAVNDDFDCSKLVSQWKEDHIIHNLKCSGQNNETETPIPKSNNGTNTSIPTPIPTSNQSLPAGAWAGIGVGVSIAAIGILGALIWLIIHFRNRLRTLERERAQKPEEDESSNEPEQPQIFQMQEVCGRGIFREKPDDPLVEMPTQPAELPTRPHSWAETEPGEVGRAL
ncbi:hypothetical protein F5B21DRAFT_520333 [Xylaria acuta]|nr:hypothetical protein F5B21DRAFT_520333 [Xylaria acuta]